MISVTMTIKCTKSLQIKVELTYQNGNQSNEKTLYLPLVPINGYENFKKIIIIIHSLIYSFLKF